MHAYFQKGAYNRASTVINFGTSQRYQMQLMDNIIFLTESVINFGSEQL